MSWGYIPSGTRSYTAGNTRLNVQPKDEGIEINPIIATVEQLKGGANLKVVVRRAEQALRHHISLLDMAH